MYGGPRQFLNKNYDTVEKRKQFAKDLLTLLPLREDVDYFESNELKVSDPSGAVNNQGGLMAMHPVMFAFHDGSSITGNPEANIAKSLTGSYSRDGFMSVYDPVWADASSPLTLQPDDVRVPTGLSSSFKMDAFSIPYVKGSSRCCTLLTICALFIQDSVSMEEVGQGTQTLRGLARARLT